MSDDVPHHIWQGASHYVPGSPATCAPRAWRCRLRRCPQDPSAILRLRGSGNVSRLFSDTRSPSRAASPASSVLSVAHSSVSPMSHDSLCWKPDVLVTALQPLRALVSPPHRAGLFWRSCCTGTAPSNSATSLGSSLGRGLSAGRQKGTHN